MEAPAGAFAPGWQTDMAPELVEATLKTVAVVERLASTLPPITADASAFYTPPEPLPPVSGDKYSWDVINEEYDVKVYGRKSDVGPPHAVGVAHFTQPAEEVAAYLFDPNNMGDWNEELCEKGQVLRMINDDAALGYLDYYGVSALGLSIVKPRNLVVLTVREARPGGIFIIASQSVSDALGPSTPWRTVRARLVSGGGVVMPSPGGGCDVMFMTQVDSKGIIPANIVAQVARNSPLALAAMRLILSGEHVPKSKRATK